MLPAAACCYIRSRNERRYLRRVRGVSIVTKMNTDAEAHTLSDKKTNQVSRFFKQNLEIIAVVLSGLLIMNGWVFSSGDWQTVAVVCYIAAFVIGGYAKAKEGIEELLQHRQLNVNMLMIFAAIGSAAIGYWTEGAVLIFIFALSGALETYTMHKSHRELSGLMALSPEEARVYEAGIERKTPVEQLRVGQTVVVKPGDRVPVDGTIIEGATSIDQSAMTGEAIPVGKKLGDTVLAGTVNVEGAILVKVDKRNEATLFQKMIQLVQKAQMEKPPQQYFIEKFEKRYVKIILLAVLFVMLSSPFLLNWTWEEAIYRGMVLLVVASPCALVASTMPALLSAISNGARRGVLFKGGTHLQNLQGVRAVAFDKTGTLTAGVPEVQELISLGDLSQTDVLQVTASIEQLSTHPLAEAIVRKAHNMGIELFRPQEMVSVTGFGVRAKVNGTAWKVGKREWIDGSFNAVTDRHVARLTEQGKTVVYVQRDAEVVGLLALEDAIRRDVKHVIAQLKKQGIHTVMLTGDSKETAKSLAQQAGLDHYYANCLPDQKVECVRDLQRKYGKVVMVGDGVNDAPALAAASVGVGMGAGTDVALQTADIVLVKNELTSFAFVIRLAKRAERVIKQNIVFSVGVIIVLIAANFLQSINLPLGVVGHEGSTILVILNGLRLLILK